MITLNGLEEINEKRIRVYKSDQQTEIKNFIISSNPKQLLVILPYYMGANRPYVLRDDKSLNRAIKLTSPTEILLSKYLWFSKSAIVNNKLHIFGGHEDFNARKVGSILNGPFK